MEQAADRIKAAIESSINQYHLDGCEILLDLFAKKYGESCKQVYNELLAALMEKQTFLTITV
jgi:hypothetical protein